MPPEPARATVVVIGAGQAGLSAAYHLNRRRFGSALQPGNDGATYVVLDAAAAPGGAWQHRWESLRMSTINAIFDLPGMPVPSVDPDEPSRDAVPRYFAAYEFEHGFPLVRPVRVTSVRDAQDGSADADADAVGMGTGGGGSGDLIVQTDRGSWVTQWVINATGTWDNPVWPVYPGAETFLGRQLHTRDYVAAEEFAGQRVAIVGGGISAVQQLEEISRHATTFWYTRREPVFHEGEFTSETGREVIANVTADVEEGRPTGSVVSYTGLGWTPYALAAKERGALVRREMFTAIEPGGVREADGSLTQLDVILWATGFKGALAHLDPLELRNEQGGIMLRETQVADEPRVHLIGFGPSQSTVGANRAGRAAVAAIVRARRGT
ncbi:NAD(P)-binding domain-containing protein [Pseudactinotalea sp. Z1732]|uniref:NAD(P)-binding domain-containing protein n=1 Tax=Micrococcales TaxID=85006 RepID=UPI003C7CBA5F